VVDDPSLGAVTEDSWSGEVDACRAWIGQRDAVNECGRLVAEPVPPLNDEIGGADPEQRPDALGIERLPVVAVDEDSPSDTDPPTSP
jgi:hypothetical protein